MVAPAGLQENTPCGIALVTGPDDLEAPGGPAWARLAEALAEGGHRVSWLLVQPERLEPRRLGALIDQWAGRSVQLCPLPAPDCPPVHTGPGCATAYAVHDWLRHRRIDTVCFGDGGIGHVALAARRQGLAYAGTRMVVRVTRPTLWTLAFAQVEAGAPADAVESDFLERQSAAWADAALLPHAGLGAWLRGAGWAPADTMVLPDLPAVSAGPSPALAFLARSLGDVHLALAAHRSAGRPSLRVPAPILEEARRISGDRMAVACESSGDGTPAVAVVLSEEDPAPHCDAPVLLVPEGLFADGALTYPRHPAGLAAALERAGTAAPRPPTDRESLCRAWLAALLTAAPARPPAQPRVPSVSVCVVHHRRPALLRQALASVAAQSRPADELVLVDDGSGDPESLAALDELEAPFAARGWRILRQENRYLGAARNAAAAAARGDALLFLDDDNLLRADALETALRVRAATGAEIVTGIAEIFDGDAPPRPGAVPAGRIVPAGGCAALGLFRNAFGDATALIDRRCFDALGGFTELRGVGHEDWEFFARAVLRGHRLEVAAAPLLWYRRHGGGSMLAGTAPAANLRRALAPYLAEGGALLPLALAARTRHLAG